MLRSLRGTSTFSAVQAVAFPRHVIIIIIVVVITTTTIIIIIQYINLRL